MGNGASIGPPKIPTLAENPDTKLDDEHIFTRLQKEVWTIDVAISKIPEVMAELRKYKSARTDVISPALQFFDRFSSSTTHGDDTPVKWGNALQKNGMIPIIEGLWPSFFLPNDVLKEIHDVSKRTAELCAGYNNLRLISSAMWDLSDSAKSVCQELCEKDMMKNLVEFLNRKDLLPPELETSVISVYFVKSVTGVIHNCLRHDEGNAKSAFRKAGGIELAKKLQPSKNERIRIKASILLAHSLSEEEVKALSSLGDTVSGIMKILNGAVKNANHRYDGFSVEETMQTVNAMAVNDELKMKLIDENCLTTYLTVLTAPKEDLEIIRSLNGLWNLSFKDDVQVKIREHEGLIKAVTELVDSDNPQMKKPAQGIIWNLDAVENNKKAATGGKKKTIEGHIMLSYDWGHKAVILKLNEALKEKGFKTWMDVDQMSGSTLEAMANAIEQASIVVICLSERYKDSSSCRTEAEYAYRIKKPIVPVRTQYKYMADGWLGIIAGTRLYFDIQNPEQVEPMLPRIQKDIERYLKGRDGSASSKTTKKFKKKQSEVMNWKQAEIKKWLDTAGLTHLQKNFVSFDGPLLMDLHKMYEKSPTAYYQSVQTGLGIKAVPDVLKLTRFLEQLE